MRSRDLVRGGVAALLAVLAVAALVASMTLIRPRETVPADPSRGEELAAQVMLFEDPPGHVEFCLAWGESLPPSCGGPSVVGDIDWPALDPQTSGDVRWAEGVWIVGRFDEPRAAFTLTRPPSLDRPDGLAEPEEVPTVEFPALCEDPTRGASGRGTNDELQLHEVMLSLPGYVNSYVSDGRDFYNVIVNEDPEGAHAKLREVWQGDLCVAEQELPTFAAREAATDAVFTDESLRGELVSGGGGGIDGFFDVQVMVASEEVVDRIHELTRPHIDDRFVRISGAFQPVD